MSKAKRLRAPTHVTRAQHFIRVRPGMGCWWFYKDGSFNEALRDKGDKLTAAQAQTIRAFCETIYEMGRDDARQEMREALGL